MKKVMNLYDDKHWEDANEYVAGTKKKVLRDENGCRTVLLKLPKNFYMAPHSHITTEQHFVLDGEYTSKGETYPAGSYQFFSKGDEHGPFESKNGALVLIIWDPIRLKNKNRLQLTLTDVIKTISEINYPKSKFSLIDLGIVSKIQLLENKVVLVFAFPSLHLPMDCDIVKCVSEKIHNLDLDLEYEIRKMTDEEKSKFSKLEAQKK
ncbi:MAG: cupin domain-containing protein [Bacteroidales bacterium]